MSLDFRTPMQLCPHCGYAVDAHGPTGKGSTAPGEGDFCVCLACAGVSRFGPSMKMISTTVDDPDLDPEAKVELRRTIEAIETLRRRSLDWPNPYRGRTQ